MTRDLVVRAQAGDQDAYERLARFAADRLFLVAGRILRDHDMAEDAVQQTLVAIWRDLPTLRDPDRFDAWTFRVLLRACRAQERRTRRLRATVADVSSDVPDPRREIEAVGVRDQLDRAFAGLSREHRAVVVLHHLVGMSLVEVAEVLDVPYGTVASRLHRAMGALRAEVDRTERTGLPEGRSI